MPVELDPIKSAVKRSDYSGIYLLDDLPRLRDMTAATSGEVAVSLRCAYDAQRLPVMHVEAQMDTKLSCERCGDPFEFHVELVATFTPRTRSLEEELVPSEYEIVDTDDYGLLDFRALLEDEIILNIPIVPKHAEADCRISEADMSWGRVEPEPEQAAPNPFEVLKNLKVQKD